jgi:exosortase A
MAGSNFLRWFWIVLLFTCAIAVFWPTLWQMESIWRHSETYMHGYFIVPMSLYMIWTRRESLHGLVMQPAVLPALLLIPVCLLWLAAYAIDVGFVTHISQVVAFQLILWHVLGNDIARKIRFPLLFLIFAAPFGESLTPILQDLTADMSVALLRLVDIPVYRQGLYIHTPVSVFEVAVACSGLNFLISSTVISLLFASMYFSKFYKQIIFVLFVPMLAILANGLRAFLLIFIGETTNMAWGFGDDHYYYGWAVFAITILISFRIGEWFSDPPEQSSTAAVQQTSSNNSKMKTRFASTAIAIVILASFYPLRSFLPKQ